MVDILLFGECTTLTYTPQRSISSITCSITGDISTADYFEHDSRRTIVDYFLDKLETIKANIVLAGSVIFCDNPMITPPLYVNSDFTWISSIWIITFRSLWLKSGRGSFFQKSNILTTQNKLGISTLKGVRRHVAFTY